MCKCTDQIAELEKLLEGERKGKARAQRQERELNQRLIKDRLEYAISLTKLQEEANFLREELKRVLLQRSELREKLKGVA